MEFAQRGRWVGTGVILRYPFFGGRGVRGPVDELIHCVAMARQHLGQHFLGDSDWREQIAEAIGVSARTGPASAPHQEDFCWIEIGPGHGELTEYLARTGKPVHAIELDESLLEHLNRLKKKYSNLEVIHGDVLSCDLRAIAAGRRMKIYGSLPYYITSPILHHLFQFAECIDEIHVVVQTEVAERMAAQPGSKAYGYLSVATQLHARADLVLEIPCEAFQPPPEVGSTLVTLRLPGVWAKLRENENAGGEEHFLQFVKLCFAQKRKTLLNNLRVSFSPEAIRGSLEEAGLRADVRAEQISIGGLAELWGKLRNIRPTLPIENEAPS